jgi:hypothetical protein
MEKSMVEIVADTAILERRLLDHLEALLALGGGSGMI